MRKALLIIGIIIIVLCVAALLYAALNIHGYHNIYDGSPSLYHRLHRRGIIFAVIGVVLAVLAAVSFILSAHTSKQTVDAPLPVDKLISYKLPSGYHRADEYPYYGEDGNPIAEKSYSEKDGGYFTVGVLSYKGKDCVGDETQTVSLDEYVASLNRKKEVAVGGETGYFGTRESDDMPDMVGVVYVSHGDYVFEFRITNSDEQITEKQVEMLEKVVASVDFKV